jgi:hypothetical protein
MDPFWLAWWDGCSGGFIFRCFRLRIQTRHVSPFLQLLGEPTTRLRTRIYLLTTRWYVSSQVAASSSFILDRDADKMRYGDFFTRKISFSVYGHIYNWDPPETPKWAIQVDGHRCKVYTNVVSILKSMRSTYRFQYVWIDSVCIDQSNNAEKSAQVRIMRQIYENASYVVGWLGGADYSGSNYLATMVKMFIRFLKGDTTEHRAINMIFRINSSRYLQDISPQASPQEFYQQHPPALWDALGSLTRNRWFERVWKYKKLQCRRK